MTYGWMLLVAAIVGGAIFATVQGSMYDVTVDGYLTHDGERAELGYVEVHKAGSDPRCGDELDAATSARESSVRASEKGDISFKFEASNITQLEFCSASDVGHDELIASRSANLQNLLEETISAEYPTEGYTVVVENVEIEPAVVS